MSEWYLSHDGNKSGPLRAKQIARLIAGGAFRATEAMVWRQGMHDWKSVADSGLLAEASLDQDEPKSPVTEQPTEQSPYKSPKSQLPSATEQPGDNLYGGIGRAVYFFAPAVFGLLWILAFYFGLISAAHLNLNNGAITVAAVVFYLVFLGFILWMHLARLKNLGMSGWWILGMLVPFLNFWLSWRLTACPEGYAYHKELDLPGKILTFLVLILPLAAVAFLFLSAAGAALMEGSR